MFSSVFDSLRARYPPLSCFVMYVMYDRTTYEMSLVQFMKQVYYPRRSDLKNDFARVQSIVYRSRACSSKYEYNSEQSGQAQSIQSLL